MDGEEEYKWDWSEGKVLGGCDAADAESMRGTWMEVGVLEHKRKWVLQAGGGAAEGEQ